VRATAPSFQKVHYALRPAKQVERRMFIDAFIHLSKIGFPVSDYHYVGMGSVYFVDYIMFHRYLNIADMTSVEKRASAKRRLRFNRPFNVVDVRIGDIAGYVSSLSPDTRYIVCLDYDNILNTDVINALKLALVQLCPGSVLIVTVDAMPPGGSEDGPREWMEYFKGVASSYLWLNPSPEDFGRSKLLKVNTGILQSVIDSGLAGRNGITFSPLFEIWYQDGHEMLTIGGVISSHLERDLLKRLDIKRFPYLRTRLSGNPYRIRVPLITRKEKLQLDSTMPGERSKAQLETGLTKKDIKDYEKIYRFYPDYAEMYL
jgi:hypothetical protein